MAKPPTVADHSLTGDASLLLQLLGEADQVFVKKLANNDRDWARYPSKHQAGPYIPVAERDSGFFPPMAAKGRTDGRTGEIREVGFTTLWPQGGETRSCRLVNYRSKGAETHLTRLPKSAFADLGPASFLVMGRVECRGQIEYHCLTIDSAADDALVLADALSLPVDFQATIKVPAEERRRLHDRLLSFAE